MITEIFLEMNALCVRSSVVHSLWVAWSFITWLTNYLLLKKVTWTKLTRCLFWNIVSAVCLQDWFNCWTLQMVWLKQEDQDLLCM